MILLLDIDGTLVDHTTHLPPSAEAAVRAAVAAGHRLYACTGRARAEVYPELWDLGLHGMIGGNGSYVESDGAVLLHQVLDPDAVGAAVDWLLGKGLPFYIECNAGLYGTDDLLPVVAALYDGPREETLAMVTAAMPDLILGAIEGAGPDAPWRTDTNKISFVLRDDVDLDALATELGAGVQVDTWSLTGSGPEFGEVGQVGVHKGHAVRLLAEHLGATASDLVGFGDARSDIELLRACGTGVAMGQAPDELKAVATFVTRPVDEDGLAHAFDHLGLTGPLTPSR